MNELGKVRLGNWLPRKDELIEIWIKNLKVKVLKRINLSYNQITEFKKSFKDKNGIF